MKNKFAPTLVLGSICLVASLLLAVVYQITAPMIEEINIKNANEARAEVLAEAGEAGFEDITPADAVEGVTEVYKAKNGSGVVITSKAKGFGGNITVMTAVDPSGNIIKIKVTDASNETPGLGSKTTLPSHTDKFTGKTGVSSDKDDANYIAPVTGASYSSKGVFNAVDAAMQQFAKVGGAL